MPSKTITASIIFVLSGCILLSLSACSLQQSARPSWDNGILRVGITPNYPCLIHKASGTGVISGFEAEAAELLAKRLHSKLEFIELEWGDQIPALERKEIDIVMSAMSITEMRKIRVAFSKPYLTINQMALTTKEGEEKFPSVQAILASRSAIGVEKGTTGDVFVQRYCPTAEPFFFSSPDAAVQALRDKRIELYIDDSPILGAYAAAKDSEGLVLLPIPLTSEELAWAVRQDDQALLRKVNFALETWKEDGTLQKLLKRWLPQ